MRDDYLNREGNLHAEADPRVERLNRALVASTQVGRLNRALHAAGADSYGGAVLDVLSGLAVQLEWTGGAAVVGGAIMGVVCSEVPVIGTAGGARIGAQLGAAVVGWVFTIMGLPNMVMLAGSVSEQAAPLIQQGIDRCWNSNREEEAADLFAAAWVRIGVALMPILVMTVMHGGGMNLIRYSAKYPRLNAMLQGLPKSVKNWRSVALAQSSGLSEMEFQALKAMSLGKFILIRACNPDRLRWRGKLLAAKMLDVKAKTLRDGKYRGAVAMDAHDLEVARTNYQVLDEANGRVRFKSSGDLEGFSAEPIRLDTGEERLLLRDPEGQLVVGDIDRVSVMEFTANGVPIGHPNVQTRLCLRDIAKSSDDQNEIAWFNALLNQYAGAGAINKAAAMHGCAQQWLGVDGRSRYQAKVDEDVLLFSNGQAFAMKWNEMVVFMAMNRGAGLPNVFDLVKNAAR